MQEFGRWLVFLLVDDLHTVIDDLHFFGPWVAFFWLMACIFGIDNLHFYFDDLHYFGSMIKWWGVIYGVKFVYETVLQNWNFETVLSRTFVKKKIYI